MDFLDRFSLEQPIVQAGMGGGIAGAQLAGAVSAAGALGTVGIMGPQDFQRALVRARGLARGQPVAANLLTPFIRRAHVQACVEADAALVVFHGGWPADAAAALRQSAIAVFATVGTAAQARDALAAGADGLVVQAIEAGGHLVGCEPMEIALPAVLEVADHAPVLAAGGIAQSHDVQRVLDMGAAGAVAGTRFLLTEESGAHPAYKSRVLAAQRTLVTGLFGLGWPLHHRVTPNAATERWAAGDGESGWLGRASRASAPLGRLLPLDLLAATLSWQRSGFALFGPGAPLAGMSDRVVDASALYAGESLHRISALLPAAEAVRQLVPRRTPGRAP